MLFCVRVEIEKPPGIGLGALLDAVEREWRMVSSLMRRGKVLAAGKISGKRGAIAIFDVTSSDELDTILGRLPLFPYFTRIDITPLVSPTTALLSSRRRKRLFTLLGRGESECPARAA